jgi:hypothetical protein
MATQYFQTSRFNMGASFAQNWRAAALAQCCGEKILRRTLTTDESALSHLAKEREGFRDNLAIA